MLQVQATHSFKLNAIHKLQLNLQHLEPLHGHEYKYYVTLKGVINPDTGYLLPHQNVQNIVSKAITQNFDKNNLNHVLTFSSGEFLAKEIFNRLLNTELKDYLHKIIIEETTKNRFEYPCPMKK